MAGIYTDTYRIDICVYAYSCIDSCICIFVFIQSYILKAVFTVPHWDEVVTDAIAAKQGDPLLVLHLYGAIFLANIVHTEAFVVLLKV